MLAIDGDRAVNAPIEYALFGGGAIFSIDTDSGAIYVAGALDRERRIETNGAYILTIGVSRWWFDLMENRGVLVTQGGLNFMSLP